MCNRTPEIYGGTVSISPTSFDLMRSYSWICLGLSAFTHHVVFLHSQILTCCQLPCLAINLILKLACQRSDVKNRTASIPYWRRMCWHHVCWNTMLPCIIHNHYWMIANATNSPLSNHNLLSGCIICIPEGNKMVVNGSGGNLVEFSHPLSFTLLNMRNYRPGLWRTSSPAADLTYFFKSGRLVRDKER